MIWFSHLFISMMNFLAPLFGRPRVGDVGTDDLVRLLGSGDGSCVLVDVRSDCEIGVSTIPGAIDRDEFFARREELANKLVIAYCTVGGRSLLFAQRCANSGFAVRNYRGSILAWCAAGKRLVAPDGSQTNRVHTHNRLFEAPIGYERVL
jgi:rhodanese-related sulfurtransferase